MDITIETLMADADEMFGRINIPGETAWQEEGSNIPDDAYPEEGSDDDSQSVTAADAGNVAEPATVDSLSAAVLEDLTGVAREWLSPVRPYFERLAALAMSKNVTDEDFMAALEKAQREMPELFDALNTEALEAAFEKAIGTAMIAGSVKRYEP